MNLFMIGVIQLVSATTVLVPPEKIVCPGDVVTFNCSVTLSTCGVLSWSVDNIAVGSFLDITGQLGTRASNPDFPGVVASITDIDVDANNISSSLTITSAGINVPHGSQILCTDHFERDQRDLVIAMTELNTTVRPTLRSASVTVESRDPSALECITLYYVEVEPTAASQPTPSPVNSTSNMIIVPNLNFCKSNYSFRVMAHNRNNISFNDSVLNIAGDLNALNILIEPFQNGSALRWEVMRSDHPENCDAMYEVMFNGKNLSYLVPTTQVSQEMLIREGFPLCQSTVVSIAPYTSAHNVIRNFTKTTTYLAIPNFSGPNNVISLPKFVYKTEDPMEFQVELKWDTIPSGTFGPRVEVSTAANFTCSLVTVGQQGLRLSSMCNSSTDHTFPVTDRKPFGKTFSANVRVDYFECKNRSSVSFVTVSAAIVSFPRLIVGDKSVDITLDVNITLVPNGSNVSVTIPSIKVKPQKPVFGGKFITMITDLQPKTTYTYTIAFFMRGTGTMIIDQPVYGQFTTKESMPNLLIIISTSIAAFVAIVLIIIVIVVVAICIYCKHLHKKK